MTNIYFSPTYTGHVFLKSAKDSVMMDTQVVSLAGLVALLELRLGIHHDDASPQQRIICYHDCMKQYLAQKKGCLFAKSFEISPLSTAKAVLAWRDELRWTGWSSALSGTGASERLQDLARIEKLFEKKPDAYDMVNHLDILECMLKKQSIKIVDDLKIFLPYDKSLMRPKVIELLDMLEKYGASIKQTPTATGGNNNLSTVSQLLCASTAEGDATLEKVTLADKKADDSLLIWRFPDECAAAEYLAYKELADIDVWINADNKQMDNWLARMRRPLTGSVAKQCTPQLTQLFVIGLGLFRKTLNINTLMGWLTMPLHPLEGYFRAHLTAAIAREGGYRNDACREIINKYIAGDYVYLTEEKRALPDDEQQKIRQEHAKQREQNVCTYLPPTEKPTDKAACPSVHTIATQRLRDFASGMEGWARQQAFLTADNEQLRREQLLTVADLFKSFTTLLKDYGQPAVDETTLTLWVNTLYQKDDYTYTLAEQHSRIVVDSPAKIISVARRTVWIGFDGDNGSQLECAFLSPAEHAWLDSQPGIVFWAEASEHVCHELDMTNAFRRTAGQLILVCCDRRDGEPTNPHPLMVRLLQQVKNIEVERKDKETKDKSSEGLGKKCGELEQSDNNGGDITERPCLAKEKTVKISTWEPQPMEPEIKFKNAELIRWPDHLSPTTLSTLVDNPLDYVLHYLLHIEHAQEAQLPTLQQTKGNVAHAVIQHLFAPRDKRLTTPDEAAGRIEREFGPVCDKQIEAKGGQLALTENKLEQGIFLRQLRKCVNNLLDIIRDNHLCVVACEQQVEGRFNGLRLPINEEHPDRNLTGFIDMALEDNDGKTVVFDFKWTNGHYYPDVLKKNRSTQLQLYRYMLSQNHHITERVAYFLMPEGHLYSREAFVPTHFTQVQPDQSVLNDYKYKQTIIEPLRKSIIYRKEQIDRGEIETEGKLADKQYIRDIDSMGLLPLEAEKDSNKKPTDNKQPNHFSDYPLLNGTTYVNARKKKENNK